LDIVSTPLHLLINRSTERREKRREKEKAIIRMFSSSSSSIQNAASRTFGGGTHGLPSGTRRAHFNHHQQRSKSLQSDTNVSPKKMASAFAFDDASPPSGEWEGHMVDFIVDPETKLPNATKLPDYIVPQAYDDWEVFVYDWQTQCAMKANGSSVIYKDMKFIPVAGCEVDASVIHEQFEGEMMNVRHFNEGSGDFNANDDQTVTHVLTRKGGTDGEYIDSEPFVRVRITQNREDAKRDEVKVWREAYYEKYTNGASLVASCGGTKNTMKYGEYPRSEVKFHQMEGVPKEAITQYNGLDIWTFTDGRTFSCGWLTPGGEHIVSERVLEGSETISAKITRTSV
jgi:hypothetical protein